MTMENSEAAVLSNIGLLHCQRGECHKAISYYLDSLRILSPLNQPAKEALATHNLGTAYGTLGDNESAAEYIQRSLPFFRKTNNRVGEGRARMNLGDSVARRRSSSDPSQAIHGTATVAYSR